MDHNSNRTLFFDIGGLVKQLNSVSSNRRINSDDFLDLGITRSVSDLFETRSPEKRVACSIYNAPEIALCHMFNSEGKIGYIQVTTGQIGKGSDYSPTYEELIMIIKKPVELKDGRFLPRSLVSHVYAKDSLGRKAVDCREDFAIPLLVFQKSANYMDILPPESYLRA
jgi:hypothetical protein